MAARLDAVLAPESVLRTKLPNGLTVLARRDTTAPVVAIVTWVRAGYFDEPDDRVGIAHVLEHMYFKGTPTRGVGEIARETKAAGGYLNAGTIYDHTHYYTVLPASGFDRGLEVQADAYANSVIDEAELARELEVIIEETKRKADTPGALALESLFELLHDEHRIRRWRMGREGPLRAMTREKLMTFYRNYYRPSNTVLAIVGDIDPVVATERAAALYGSIADARVERTPGPVERTAPGFRVREWQGDIAQTELVFGWRAPPLAHEDTPVLDVLATVLAGGRASRLVRAARDRRLVSNVNAFVYSPTEIGVFVVHANARPERTAHAARAIWDQLRRVREGEITADEIERARRLLEAQWLRRLESPEGQANFLGSWELLGDWRRGADYHERLHETTAAMLTAVAKKWLDPATAGIIAYRPRGFPALGADAHAVHQLLDDGRPAPVDPAAPRTAAPALVGRGARHERTVGDVQLFRTADDVPILVRRRPGAALAHLGCFVAGGVIAEGAANSGITTLMARSALRGTSRRTASRLAEDAELLGGTPSAIVGTESFHWSLGVPRRSFGGAAELLADLVLDPAFPDEGVDAERAVTIASIAAMRDDMYRQPLRLAAMLAWPDHPYGRSTLGAEESVGTLTPDALREWHVARVRESAAVLCAVGDLDPQQAADVLAKRFAGLRLRSDPTLPPPAWPSKFVSTVEQRDKAQTALAMLFPGPRRGEKAQFDAELIGGIASGLGGRLFEELRDRQSLAYTVLARAYPKARSGAFAAYIATSPAKEGVAREGLLRELARFTTDPVTTEELERARNYALGVWKIRQASGAAVLAEVADAWLHGSLEDITRYPDDLAAVTPARVKAAARSWFDPARRVEGIVRGSA